MKIRKFILLSVAVVIVAIVAASFWAYNSLDSLVQAAMEKYGSEITQVSVKVAAVRLAPASGEGEIKGLVLGNPKGFTTDSALKVGAISLRIDPASLTRDVVVIREVVIQSPQVTYESGDGNNLETIQKNIEAYVTRMTGGKKDETGPTKKFIIENVYIRDGQVTIKTPLTLGKTLSSGIPDLHLRDVGKRSNGATAGEVAGQVWQALLRSTGNVASKIGGAISDGARGAVDSVKRLFK